MGYNKILNHSLCTQCENMFKGCLISLFLTLQMPRGQLFVQGRSPGGHSRRGDYWPSRDSHGRDQHHRSDVYPGQARDLEVRRERGVADPRQEADDHR